MAEQERKVYNFNSVGITEQRRDEIINSKPRARPIGIKTPMRLSEEQGSVFSMHTRQSDQVRDNFINMLMTNHGERLWLYDYGANLTPLAFELGSDDFDNAALSRISATTRKYMPFIELSTFEVVRQQSETGDLAKVAVRVGFTVPSLLMGEQIVEAIIYAAS